MGNSDYTLKIYHSLGGGGVYKFVREVGTFGGGGGGAFPVSPP